MDSNLFISLSESLLSLENVKAVHLELMQFISGEMTAESPSKKRSSEPRLSDFYRRSNKKLAYILPLSGFGIAFVSALIILMFGKLDPSAFEMSEKVFKLALLILMSAFGAALGYGAYAYYIYQRKVKAKKKYKNALDSYYASFTKEKHDSSSKQSKNRSLAVCLDRLTQTEAVCRQTLVNLYNKTSLPFNARDPRSVCIACEQCAERGSVDELKILLELAGDETYICGKYEEHLALVRSTVDSLKNSYRSTGSTDEIERYTVGCMQTIEKIS